MSKEILKRPCDLPLVEVQNILSALALAKKRIRENDKTYQFKPFDKKISNQAKDIFCILDECFKIGQDAKGGKGLIIPCCSVVPEDEKGDFHKASVGRVSSQVPARKEKK